MKKPLLAGLLVTIVFGTFYVSMQQELRQNSYDPQIQIAEDLAAALAAGVEPEKLTPSYKVEMTMSLAPFHIIYDASGKPIAGNGTLRGLMPAVPQGLLKAAYARGQRRLSWAPEPQERIAAVVQPVKKNGEPVTRFVLAGRSLREVDIRERKNALSIGAGWLASLLVLAFAVKTKKPPFKEA